jgi:exodeoxyribonuclease VII large subunit
MILQRRNEIMTVDEATDRIRLAVCSAPELKDLAVRGELLGFKRHTSGHVYFTILGKESRISCVMFRSNAASVITWPRDGDEVLVRGRIDVYGAYGSYQLYASALLPIGAGAKARAKEMLRLSLEKEGVFDVRAKRPLPRFPEKVAVLTSPTGAALQDVIKISSLRYPCAKLVVVPSLMQGVGAAEEIARGFARCAAMKDLDLVMLVRGGGSRDDLDVFDQEQVVRALRSCPVPVVTGLGHQIDSTLCDLAADAFAPTPSGAAERVFPDRRELLLYISGAMRSMQVSVNSRIERLSAESEEIRERLAFGIERFAVAPASDSVENAYASMTSNVTQRLKDAGARLAQTAAALQSASPLAVLARGYSFCTRPGGEPVRDAASLKDGDLLNIRMRDGSVSAAVTAAGGAD